MSFWHDLTHAPFWLELARGDMATWIQLTPYAYAGIEAVHLVGIAFFFGPVFLLDLKLLGLVRRLGAASGERFLSSIAALAFGVIGVSGILMFISSADRHAASSVFLVKMSAIVLGGANALALHTIARRAGPEGAGRARWIPRASAAVSVLVWVSVIALGRSMGYELREPPDVDIDTLLPLGAATNVTVP